MARSFDSLSDAALILKRGSRNAAGQDLALLVEELLQELGVLVIDVLDATFFEAAVFLFLSVYRGRGKVSDF